MDPKMPPWTAALTRRHVLQGAGAAWALSLLPPLLPRAAAQAMDDPLGPVAIDGAPAQAFASHRARAAGIARSFATEHLLSKVDGKADEDKTLWLLAHAQAVAADPGFATSEGPSRDLLPGALRRLNIGDGLVGTGKDYDMALKGLMTLAYRFDGLLGAGARDFILDVLVPPYLIGGHPVAIEAMIIPIVDIGIPETENHLLMIESSRYLANQLRQDRGEVGDYNNRTNGLAAWLTGYMKVIAEHDFLEFNSRPYQRLSLHALLNLSDFARDDDVRTGARILLDYTMMKFAVSSTRGRRVTPYRRLQQRINHVANEWNYLFAEQGDQVAGMFLAITGATGPKNEPAGFPRSLRATGLIAGQAAYRPPPAAYVVALDPAAPPALHVFSQGLRPKLTGTDDQAESGTEIYYKSPSFLMSAGGSFLNSGYGFDEIDVSSIQAWEQTSRAQATTLIPARADVLFQDLLRFQPYPDPGVDPFADDRDDADRLHSKGVNLGVARGLMAGANLRPAEKKVVLEQTSSDGPSLALHNGTLFAAWRGSGNENLNVGRVQVTRLLGIDGVEGVDWVRTLADSSPFTPAIASYGGRLYIAWTGTGDGMLNIAMSDDHGLTFRGKTTLPEKSGHGPALSAHDGRLYLGWTGTDDRLNVARVVVFVTEAGGFHLEDKVGFGDTSKAAPALAGHSGRLYLGWTGTGDGQLNLMVSADGRSFVDKTTLADTSTHGPCLASHEGRLFIGWKGTGEGKLNVAPVTLIGNTAGGFGIEGLGAEVMLGERSDEAPALGSVAGMLCIGWTGLGQEFLNLRVSADGAFRPPDRWIISDRSDLGFYYAAYRAPPAQPDQLIEPLDNLGFVYAVEAAEMAARGISFEAFRDQTRARNAHLPDRLDYGGIYRFFSPDDREFSIWFELTGAKDSPRVVEIARPTGAFSTLPLVSGEYMNAPGGHDGLIELRQPGCGAPVVLDFRTVLPERTENQAACPAPYADRVLASLQLAARLEAQMPVVAAATRSEALTLYAALLAEDPAGAGPLLAGGMIAALAAMGVDYSVPEAELRDWLATPDDTPYPALAQALVMLGRRFSAPVFIDVIAWNYEHTPGVASPRRVGEVRPDVLRAAVLAGWNERYNRQEADFDAITAPL